MKKNVLLCALLAASAHFISAQTTNTFPSTGNAGIGTTSPSVKLEMVNSRTGTPANIKYLRFNDVSDAWDADGLVRQVWDVNVITHLWSPGFDASGLDFRVGYVHNSAGATPAVPTTFNSVLKLTMDGAVGIGTTMPLSKLHVEGNARITALGGSGGTKMVIANAQGELSTQALPVAPALSISGNNLTIAGGNTVALPSGSSPVLSFSGTTLSITGGSSVNLSTLKDNLGNHTATTNLNLSGKNIVGVANILFSSSYELNADVLNGALFTPQNFGVRGTADDYALDVAQGQSHGTVRCYSVNETSDRRFKSNINPIESPLQIIKKLNGVTYDFSKNEDVSKHDYGFIAQEVQQILPDLVSADSKGYLALNYRGIIPVLAEGMKEQQSVIEQQNLRIEKLEETVEKLLAASPVRPSSENEPVLFQNMPNPFNGITQIKCVLPKGTVNAQIILYNISGVQINAIRLAGDGEQSIGIDAKDLAANIYVYSLIVDGKLVDTKRMIVNK